MIIHIDRSAATAIYHLDIKENNKLYNRIFIFHLQFAVHAFYDTAKLQSIVQSQNVENLWVYRISGKLNFPKCWKNSQYLNDIQHKFHWKGPAKGNAPIFSLSDFPRVDEQLKTLVYKLVPGLYHNEIERQLQWGSSDGKDEAVNQDSEEDFFSPVEPIR